MRITIYGAGYVGLVTAACFAELGNHVICVDVDAERVRLLQQGVCPIHEPDLPELIIRNQKAERLSFTNDLPSAVRFGFYHFLAVGTPQAEDGSANLEYVESVARSIATHLESQAIVINKSTVPVGTAHRVHAIINQILNARGATVAFSVVSNPEFLREGAAVSDFLQSDRIVVGTDDDATAMHMRTLYMPFNRNRDRLICMDIRSAELTKYAANAMLATKISFMNEMSHLAERLGADIEQVRIGMGADPRIGYHFINPGCGYGGSCFPKDVQALKKMGEQVGYSPQLLTAVHAVNQQQKQVIFKKLTAHFAGQLADKTIAIWGLSFKPNTDDLREAPSLSLIDSLLQAGARIQAYDPVSMPHAQEHYSHAALIQFCDSPQAALHQADALCVLTEWNVFASPDFSEILRELRHPVIIDGRNLYDPHYLAKMGFHYYAMGRGLATAGAPDVLC